MPIARRALVPAIATGLLALLPATAGAQSSAPPAGGAAIAEIAIATVSAMTITAILLTLGFGHRSGRIGLLGRVANASERWSGVPGWASLPSAIATASLVTAVFGMYWDISLHIDVGRDAGPLANPAHYFILFGLYGIFSAGFVAMVLPKDKPSASAVRVAPGWHAPLGGVLICACGAFALLGFPLDDFWHRLFGQDVTLWGPTHLMLIGGASMTLLGIAVLLVEGFRANAGTERPRREPSWVRRVRLIALTGGLLLGMSTFQAEFDFGVPQFRFAFQPMLVMAAAGTALVAARLWLGRGAALGAVAFFLVIRGALALVVGPVLGQSTPHFPLYLVEAGLVELVALRIGRERPLAFGAWCGALIGTVGLAAEWAWSHVWMPLPWPAELLPEGALLGLAMAISGALVGAWIGASLGAETTPRPRALRAAGVGAATTMAALVAFALYTPADSAVSARVALTEVAPAPQRAVSATVTLDPRTAADDAEWLTATAWQGEGLVVDRLRRVAPGVYRSTMPLPVNGNWKAMVRLHSGRSLTAVPVYVPADPAIPARGVAADAGFTRPFVSDRQLLQRERKASSGPIAALAYGAVVAIALALLTMLAWGLHRLAVAAPGGGGGDHARDAGTSGSRAAGRTGPPALAR
jgi:hypothetical protein